MKTGTFLLLVLLAVLIFGQTISSAVTQWDGEISPAIEILSSEAMPVFLHEASEDEVDFYSFFRRLIELF